MGASVLIVMGVGAALLAAHPMVLQRGDRQIASAPSNRQQTNPLPAPEALPVDLPAIFNIVWLEGLFPGFTGYGSSASELRHYSYTEYDTVSYTDRQATYRLGPFETTGVQNSRVWFSELRNYGSLTPKELQDRDRDQETLDGNRRRALSKSNEEDASPTLDTQALDLAAAFNVAIVRREQINGCPVILVTVRPHPQYKPKTEIGKLAQRFDVRVWVAEEGHDVARVEAELLAPIILDLIYREGSVVSIERQMIEGAWLPVKSRIAIPQFGIIAAEYSNFKRFSADVLIQYGKPMENVTP